jgi:hypothetical protein
MSAEPKRPDQWWQYGLITVLLSATGLMWFINQDSFSSGFGYLVVISIGAIAASSARTSWQLRRAHRALRRQWQ